jgi:hypothetical protein
MVMGASGKIPRNRFTANWRRRAAGVIDSHWLTHTL